jgi:threonine/homoserine/homoserine lactone efflux protein
VTLFNGILVGMGTAFILGPVFFTLLRNSLQKGITSGLMTAVGIIVSDVLVAAICFAFAGNFLKEYVELPTVKFMAAAILMTFGVSFIRKPINDVESVSSGIIPKDKLKSFAQGFLVNFINPAVFLLWIVFVTLGESQYSTTGVLVFLGGILIGVFITDASKAIGASYLSPYLNSIWLKKLFVFLGVVLLGLGCYLIYQGVSEVLLNLT